MSTKTRSSCAIMLAWVACAGCTQLEERTTLQGQVCLRACATDSYLAGLQVELQLASEPGASDRPVTLTDHAGQFIFFNVSSVGRYRLVVKDETYRCPPLEELIVPGQDDLRAIEVICQADPSSLFSEPMPNACGLDLPNEDFAGLDLTGANFTGANLANADLTRADLSRATLTGANLTNARLVQARLSEADLSGRARGCDLTERGEPTRLIGAQMSDVDLEGADLAGADLSNADLAGARLIGSDLTGALLSDANLAGSEASGLLGCPARLPEGWSCLELRSSRTFALIGAGVDLTDVALVGAALDGSDLTGANLAGADLTGATLLGADLTGVNLSRAALGGVAAHGLLGCPAQLPLDWRCVAQPRFGQTDEAPGQGAGDERFALVGPAANLQRAELSGAALSGAVLTHADLTDADLREADLTSAALAGATLQGARMHALVGCPGSGLPEGWRCVRLGGLTEPPDGDGFAVVGPGVNLRGADLSFTDLSGSDLSGSDLRASFTGADLSGANLRGADLSGASLYRADLGGADITDADLFGGLRAANMAGCPTGLAAPWRCVAQPGDVFAIAGPEVGLSGLVDLSGADLSDRDLSRASFSSANLSRADLTGSDLSGANLNARVGGALLHDLRGCPLTSDAMSPGPGVELDNALAACLDALPVSPDVWREGAGWRCVHQPAVDRFAFIGVGVNLTGADLSGARFTDALLMAADLSDVDLTGSWLEPEQVACARWSNTTCPDNTNSDQTEDATCNAHLTPR